MTLIAYIFAKLQTAKDLIRPLSIKRRYRTPFDSEYAKGSQTLLKCARQNFYQIFSALWRKLSQKMSLLVICELLGLFVNTLTFNDKRLVGNSDNLVQPI